LLIVYIRYAFISTCQGLKVTVLKIPMQFFTQWDYDASGNAEAEQVEESQG